MRTDLLILAALILFFMHHKGAVPAPAVVKLPADHPSLLPPLDACGCHDSQGICDINAPMDCDVTGVGGCTCK